MWRYRSDASPGSNGATSPRLDTLDELLKGCGLGLDLVDRPGRNGSDVDPGATPLSVLQRARLSSDEEPTRIFRAGGRP